MGSMFSRPVCILAGMLYPAYKSFKALKSPGEDDDKLWLTYWVVYALSTSVESVTDIFISWFPGYYTIKTLFLLWLMLPQTRGAILVYDRILHPLLLRHEDVLDEKLVRMKKVAVAYAIFLKRKTATIAKRALSKIHDGSFTELLDHALESPPVSPSNKSSPP